MRLICLLFVFTLSSCTSVQGVIDNKEIYCSQLYKGIRAVGRSALSATAGVVVPDVCDTIDEIVAEEGVPSVSEYEDRL